MRSGTGEITLVRILAVGFMNDKDVGQAALDVEMAVLVQGHPPCDRMAHRSTPDAVENLSSQDLASRL